MAKKIVEKEEYDIKFDFGRAFKIFIYNLLFFLFGHLFVCIALIFEKVSFMKNLGYIWGHTRFLVIQSILTYSFIGFMILSYTYPLRAITYGERTFLIITILARCFIIAVRYGFMSKLRYKLLHSKANISWISADFLVIGWLKLSPISLKEEIRATKHRLQIPDDNFMFNFTQNLPPELSEKFSKEDYYENNKFDNNDIKRKIVLQRRLHKKRRTDGRGSFIDDELDVIHASPRNKEDSNEDYSEMKMASFDKISVGSKNRVSDVEISNVSLSPDMAKDDMEQTHTVKNNANR